MPILQPATASATLKSTASLRRDRHRSSLGSLGEFGAGQHTKGKAKQGSEPKTTHTDGKKRWTTHNARPLPTASLDTMIAQNGAERDQAAALVRGSLVLNIVKREQSRVQDRPCDDAVESRSAILTLVGRGLV